MTRRAGVGSAGIHTYGGILWDSGSLAGDKRQRYGPLLSTSLDSGVRRNDEWGAGLTKGCREWRMSGCRSGLSRIGVRDMLS